MSGAVPVFIDLFFRMQSLSKLKRAISKMSTPKNEVRQVAVKPCNVLARGAIPTPNKPLLDLKWVVLTDDRIGNMIILS